MWVGEMSYAKDVEICGILVADAAEDDMESQRERWEERWEERSSVKVLYNLKL